MVVNINLNKNLKSKENYCEHMGSSWFVEKQPSSLNAHYRNTQKRFCNSVGFRVLFPVF